MYRSGPRPRSWRGVYFPHPIEERIAEFITSHPRASHPLASPIWITSYQLQLLHGRVLHDAVPLRLSTSSISNSSSISLVADLLKPDNETQLPTSPTLHTTPAKTRRPFAPPKWPPIPAVAAMLALSPPRRTSSAFQSLMSNNTGDTTSSTSPTPLWMTPSIQQLLQKAHPADADVAILIEMQEEYTKLFPPIPITSPHRYPFASPGSRDYYCLVDVAEPVAILEAIDRGRKTIQGGTHIVVPSDDDLAASRFTRQLSWKSLLSLRGSMNAIDSEDSTSSSRPWDQLSGTARLREYRNNNIDQPVWRNNVTASPSQGGYQHQQCAANMNNDDPIILPLGEAAPLRPLPKTHYRFDGTPMPDSSQEALEAYASKKLRSFAVGMGMYEEEDIAQIDDAVNELAKIFPPLWITLTAARELLPYRPIDDVRSYNITTPDPKKNRKNGSVVAGDASGDITGVEAEGERWYHSSSFPTTQCSKVIDMLLHNHAHTSASSTISPQPTTDILSPNKVTFLSTSRYKINEERQPLDGFEEGSSRAPSKRVVEGYMDSHLSTHRCRRIRAISLSSCQPLDLHPNSIIALRKWCWQMDVYTHVWGTEEDYEAAGAPLSGDPIGVYLHDASGSCLGYHYPAVFSTRYEYCLHRTLGEKHIFVKSKDGSLAASALAPTSTPHKVVTL